MVSGRNRILGLLLVWGLFCAVSFAAQRMGLPKGSSGTIPPKHSGSIKAFCLDKYQKAPKPKNVYEKVISNEDDVVVKFGNNSPIPLGEAIAEQKLKIYGNEDSFQQLDVDNLTDQPAEIIVNRFAAIGENGHDSFDYDLSIFENEKQDGIWRKQSQLYVDRSRTSLEKMTDENHVFFDVVLGLPNLRLSFSDTVITFSMYDLSDILNGRTLSAEHPLSVYLNKNRGRSFVIHKHEMMQTNKSYTGFVDRFSFGLVEAYPDITFFRDPPDTTIKEHIKKITTSIFRDTSNVHFFIDDAESFKTTDWKTIQNAEVELKENGAVEGNFHFVTKGATLSYHAADGKLIIVITGHIDEKLTEFIDYLGDANVFKGNYVMLNVCNQPPTSAVVERIVKLHGAIGVFSFKGDQQGILRSIEVKKYLLRIFEYLKNQGTFDLNRTLKTLIRDSGLIGIWKAELVNSNILMSKG